MKILFLGDVVGVSGRTMVFKSLLSIINDKQIDFVITNGENSADAGVGLTEEICKDFFNCGQLMIKSTCSMWRLATANITVSLRPTSRGPTR